MKLIRKTGDNRVTVRLTKKNLERFLLNTVNYPTMSKYMNHILNTYYKENEGITK